MEYIQPTLDGQYFEQRNSGQPFVPFGCNYFDPLTGWAPKIWQRYDHERVSRHFAQMQSLGVNIVRMFLTIQSFMNADGTIKEEGWEKAARVIETARSHGIRVEFCGPDHWEGFPDWARPMFEEDPNAYFLNDEFVGCLTSFWSELARRLQANTAYFSYDLLNEPWLKWDGPLIRKLWGQAVPKEDYSCLNGSANVQFLEFREALVEKWVRKLVQAIREADTQHMITIGFHQLSMPHDPHLQYTLPAFHAKKLTPLLDYAALHWYPYSEEEHVQPRTMFAPLERNIDMIRNSLLNARCGKPQMIEEFGWYGGGEAYTLGVKLPYIAEEAQTRWNRMVIEETRDLAAGWMCWGYADVPDSKDATRHSGLVDKHEQIKMWGHAFRELSSVLHIEQLLDRAVVDEGMQERLWKAMNKAAAGGEVVIGYLGGSITQGASSTSPQFGFASRVTEWWKSTFPTASINEINAGIGATGTYVALHRVQDDVLQHNPDVVFVDFAVNDVPHPQLERQFESLIRTILSAPGKPAVVLLYMLNRDGSNMQDIHMAVGWHYRLPMISYRDALWPDLTSGATKWESLFADQVHPNDYGHALAAKIVTGWLATVKEEGRGLAVQDAAVAPLPERTTAAGFGDGEIYQPVQLMPISNTGWEIADEGLVFKPVWKAVKSGAELEFVVEGTAIGILYCKMNTGKLGQATVQVDDG